jgi:hypothetical protein
MSLLAVPVAAGAGPSQSRISPAPQIDVSQTPSRIASVRMGPLPVMKRVEA